MFLEKKGFPHFFYKLFQEVNRMKKFLIILAVFVIFIAGFLFWFFKQNVVHEGKVEITEGSSTKQIASVLEKSGIIPNEYAFYTYVKGKEFYYETIKGDKEGFNSVFKFGSYHIKNGDYDSLIAQLNKGSETTSAVVSVTIPEGSTIFQIADILEKQNLVKKDDFLRYTNDPTTYLALQKTYKWLPVYKKERKNALEGFLHANTYSFNKVSKMDEIVITMLDETNKWYAEFTKSPISKRLNFADTMTLASVVERESKFEEDRPKVAQVFLNRLKAGMKLESDITAAYANGEHKVFMYNKDVATKSPYNTYFVKGLPIGPIASPSKSAFLGTIKPAGDAFNMIFFYAQPSGKTHYAKTLAEHEKIRLQFEKEWKALEQQQKK